MIELECRDLRADGCSVQVPVATADAVSMAMIAVRRGARMSYISSRRNGGSPAFRGVAGRYPALAQRRQIRSILNAPIRYSMYYLSATFIIFILGPLASDVDNMFTLVSFVASSYIAFYIGYLTCTNSHVSEFDGSKLNTYESARGNVLILLSGAAYFVIFGLNQLYEYGARDLGGVIQTIFDAGSAYKQKFDVYQIQALTGRVSLVGQVLVISSLFYGAFIPLAVLLWSKVSMLIKLKIIFAVFVFQVSFLYIGTMKGIGDTFLFAVAGGAILVGKSRLNVAFDGVRPGNSSMRYLKLFIVIFALAIFIYMVDNQIKRAVEFGIVYSRIVGDVSRTFVNYLFGSDIAFGIYSVLAYPTHGYFGLSRSLAQPFEFAYGAGLSPAMESYRFQFLGGDNQMLLTFPYRAEIATGWPAGQFWSTAFPWLASDMSFLLVPVFMFLMGLLFARVWITCLQRDSLLAMVALGQIMIFVAYLPANNQVLMQRQGFWIVVTLLSLWFAGLFRRKRARA
ncbi:hypothetical protein [Ancylobacter novellus]|nr:hypothetical protein [Ancylobacter novellus]